MFFITGNFYYNRPMGVLDERVPEDFEFALQSVGITLDPQVITDSKPVTLTRLGLCIVFKAVKVRNLGAELRLGDVGDAFIRLPGISGTNLAWAKAQRCRKKN